MEGLQDHPFYVKAGQRQIEEMIIIQHGGIESLIAAHQPTNDRCTAEDKTRIGTRQDLPSTIVNTWAR